MEDPQWSKDETFEQLEKSLWNICNSVSDDSVTSMQIDNNSLPYYDLSFDLETISCFLDDSDVTQCTLLNFQPNSKNKLCEYQFKDVTIEEKPTVVDNCELINYVNKPRNEFKDVKVNLNNLHGLSHKDQFVDYYSNNGTSSAEDNNLLTHRLTSSQDKNCKISNGKEKSENNCININLPKLEDLPKSRQTDSMVISNSSQIAYINLHANPEGIDTFKTNVKVMKENGNKICDTDAAVQRQAGEQSLKNIEVDVAKSQFQDKENLEIQNYQKLCLENDDIHSQPEVETLYHTETEVYSQAEEEIQNSMDDEIENTILTEDPTSKTYVLDKQSDKFLQQLPPKPESNASTNGETEHLLEHGSGDKVQSFQSEKEVGKITRDPQKSTNKIGYNEQNNKEESRNKSFVSDDPNEIRDINDPEWNKLKQLTTDEECYNVVKSLWNSVVVPNPHRDLTYHSCRSRRANRNKDTNSVNRKRAATSSPEPVLPRKHQRRRTASCTLILDKKIKDIKKKFDTERQEKQRLFDERIQRINSFFNANENSLRKSYQRHLGNIYLRSDSVRERNHSMLRLNHWMQSEREALLQDSRAARQKAKIFHGNYKSWAYSNYYCVVGKLKKDREEVLKFNQFYCGLNEIDTTVIEGKRLEEAEKIIGMYEVYEQYYQTPCI